MAPLLDQYNYELPESLIAQTPLLEREQSRMMALVRGADRVSHRRFYNLPGLLPPDSLLVINNTRVMPRRLIGQTPHGILLDVLLMESFGEGLWSVQMRKARRVKAGMPLQFGQGHLPARAEKRTEEGYWLLRFEEPDTFLERLEQFGLAPLPPYIHRERGVSNPMPDQMANQIAVDRAAYQTCYASAEGAIAVPTAGLHFTPLVLEQLREAGITPVELTLHVGLGTFTPIKVDDPANHLMHKEWIDIPAETARAILEAKKQGRPIIAVGTTTVRALESWALAEFPPGFQGWSDLFIRPPYQFRVVEGLLTNFHQPKSTLLMMVAAFHGRERMLSAYGTAIKEGYRFFSYGDCMLLLPEGTQLADS